MAEFVSKKKRCPHCLKEFEEHSKSNFRPFCSERCKLVDLGCWLDEAYRIPSVLEDGVEKENYESD